MSHSYDTYADLWEPFDGEKVMIDGLSYVIKVSSYTAIYPYKERKISVSAYPVNKYSQYYLDRKRELRDDWFIDVIGSDIELQTKIIEGDSHHVANQSSSKMA